VGEDKKSPRKLKEKGEGQKTIKEYEKRTMFAQTIHI